MTKQFIINNETHFQQYKWVTKAIQYGWYLHHSPDLMIEEVKGELGDIFIIGLATKTIDIDILPAQSIAKAKSHSEVFKCVQDWGGRWAVIVDGIVLSDVSTLRGLYYNNDKVASLPQLINNNSDPSTSLVNFKSGYFNWQLAPVTRYDNVKKVLTNQYLSLQSGKVTPLFNQSISYLSLSNYTEVYDKLAARLENEILYLSKNYNVNVALSGGFDSRLIFSVAKKVLANRVKTYTQYYPSIKSADTIIPKALDPNNNLIMPRKLDTERQNRFDEFNGWHVKDADRQFYARGQWDSFTANDVCIRGGVLELAGISGAHLEGRIKPFKSPEYDAKTVLYSLKNYDDLQMKSLEAYFSFYYEHELNFNYLKRFYLDQRIGGWLSYIESGLDLVEAHSIHLGNSANTIALMLQIPLEMMQIKGFHIDYIKVNNPSALKLPFNKKSKKDLFFAYLGAVKKKMGFDYY